MMMVLQNGDDFAAASPLPLYRINLYAFNKQGNHLYLT